MKRYALMMLILFAAAETLLWAAPAMAPDMPDLTLPTEEEIVKTASKNQAKKPKPATPQTSRKTVQNDEVIAVTNASIKKGDEYVETITPDLSKLTPLPSFKEPAVQEEQAPAEAPAAESASAAAAKETTLKLMYKPSVERDPMLSPDDVLILKHRQEEAKRYAEAERKRKIEAEKKRLADLQRQRQLELERLKDPSRDIRGRIRINGIIGQEVFIGDKVYTVGKTVLGARIVSVQPDGVVFMYKGQRFTKKIQLQ